MNYLNERLSKKKALENRTKRFAVACFGLLDSLPHTASLRIIGYQFGKSASSIGANYREVNRAESKDDFVHKLGVVLKEAAETVYWLEILRDLRPDAKEIEDLLAEAGELLRIFQAARLTLAGANKSKQSSNSPNTIEKSVNRQIEKSENR